MSTRRRNTGTATPTAGHDPPLAGHVSDGSARGATGDIARPVAHDTLVDESLESGPAILGLDMKRQRDAVHARLFGDAAGRDESPESTLDRQRDEGSGPHRDPPRDQHRIGRYLVQGTLGQGGMGRVLHAHDETLGRDVALKVLHDGRSSRGQRLLREAQALARLAHPNVVRVYDVGEIEGRLCMAMELVHGTPLDRWQREPRAWLEVVEVYLQAGRGLAAAHAEGLVHRDFKPANCILDGQGTVKVLDFGLARGVGELDPGASGSGSAPEAERTHAGDSLSDDGLRASRSHSMLAQVLTRTGSMLGTLAYMAPEQLMGKPADPRSDQFAFCVALYEALYGKRPFSGSTAIAILYAIQSKPPVAVRARAGLPPVPAWLHEVARRGLSVASHDRFPDMSALLAALERGLARRRRARGALVGAMLLVGLGGALSMSGVLQGEQPCAGLRDAPMPAWSETERQAVGEAIESAGLSEGALVRERVEAQLDAYAQGWAEARADACEATWVRREAGEQALARRMACLDDRLVHVRAAVEQLSRADRRAAAFATATIDALPSLAPCADVEALLRGPAPLPEALAEPAAEIRSLIAGSWVAGSSGDEARGIEAAERAVAAAEALPDAPALRLEALVNRGHLLRGARRWDEARRDLELALALAEREGDARAIDVLIELVLLAYDTHEIPVASAWLAAAVGKLDRSTADPRRSAQRSWLTGVVELGRGRVSEAIAATEDAVARYEALEPPVEVEHIEALVLLGEAHWRNRDLEAAERTHARALALAEAGGHLPLVARSLYKQAHLAYVQGQPAAAQPLLERSLALRDAFYGPQAAASIRSRVLLAIILQLQGQLPRAIEQAEQAKASLDARVPAQLRGEVHKQVARLHRAEGHCDQAIASYREAREAWQEVPVPNRVELALLDSDIADCLVLQGDLATARALYDDALLLLTVDTAADDRRRAYPLLGRGRLLLLQGEREAGIASLRDALALQAALAEDPALLAELRWELGRALRSPGDPAATREATALVEGAREAFAAGQQRERVAEIDAWLAETKLPPTNTDHPTKAMTP